MRQLIETQQFVKARLGRATNNATRSRFRGELTHGAFAIAIATKLHRLWTLRWHHATS